MTGIREGRVVVVTGAGRTVRRRSNELMTGIREGRVVVVTGARRGLGREHALELARQVARVVVNEAPARVTALG
jgi:hypothetical protein